MVAEERTAPVTRSRVLKLDAPSQTESTKCARSVESLRDRDDEMLSFVREPERLLRSAAEVEELNRTCGDITPCTDHLHWWRAREFSVTGLFVNGVQLCSEDGVDIRAAAFLVGHTWSLFFCQKATEPHAEQTDCGGSGFFVVPESQLCRNSEHSTMPADICTIATSPRTQSAIY